MYAAHPQGVMKYPPPPVGEDEEELPGDMYEGAMESGVRTGTGRYTWSNGAVYEVSNTSWICGRKKMQWRTRR